jgi:hypothetical protein
MRQRCCVDRLANDPAGKKAMHALPPSDQPDFVSADYRTQIGALLNARPVGLETLYDPDRLSEYFRTLY